MIGFVFAVISAACRISSEAMIDPPGESTRQNDRTHGIVFARGLECFVQIVGGGHLTASQPDALGLATNYFAITIDDRDLILRAEAGEHIGVHIVGVVHHPMGAAAAMLDAIGELVIVFEALNHMVLEAESSVQRRLIDDCPHRLDIDAAFFGSLTDDLIVHGTDQCFVLFALRGREILFGEDVGGAFKFSKRSEVGLYADPIQGSAREDLTHADSDQVEFAFGHQ